MSTVQLVPASTEAELMSSAKSFVGLLRETARDTERRRSVPASTMDGLRGAGLLRVCQPARFGGSECSLQTAYEIITTLAEGCASTAWCTVIGAIDGWMAAGYPLRAQTDLWSGNPDVFISGSVAPSAKARRVDGGFVISGRWSFSSGCDHADWASIGVIMESETTGQMAPAFLLVPRDDFSIDDDWDTYGLSGTGSKTIVCQEVFVPAHRVLTFADATAGTGPGTQTHSNPLYRVPFLSAFPTLLAAVAVGAARGAVREYVDQVSVRETRGAVAGGKLRMASLATIQLRLAEAHSATEAADLVLRKSLDRACGIIESGRALTVPERIACRREQAYAVKLAAQATELLNASTGGQGLSLNSSVQRAWRDVNAVARHISLNWDAVGTMFGQSTLGLEPVGQY